MVEAVLPIRGTNDFCCAHVALEQPEQLRPIFTDVGASGKPEFIYRN